MTTNKLPPTRTVCSRIVHTRTSVFFFCVLFEYTAKTHPLNKPENLNSCLEQLDALLIVNFDRRIKSFIKQNTVFFCYSSSEMTIYLLSVSYHGKNIWILYCCLDKIGNLNLTFQAVINRTIPYVLPVFLLASLLCKIRIFHTFPIQNNLACSQVTNNFCFKVQDRKKI